MNWVQQPLGRVLNPPSRILNPDRKVPDPPCVQPQAPSQMTLDLQLVGGGRGDCSVLDCWNISESDVKDVLGPEPVRGGEHIFSGRVMEPPLHFAAASASWDSGFGCNIQQLVQFIKKFIVLNSFHSFPPTSFTSSNFPLSWKFSIYTLKSEDY